MENNEKEIIKETAIKKKCYWTYEKVEIDGDYMKFTQ